MKKTGGEQGQYVRRVQERTQRYSQNLLQENERLRVRLAGLEATQSALEAQLASYADRERHQRDTHAQLQRLEAERVLLAGELEVALRELRQREALYLDLQRKLQAAEEDSQRSSRGYADVERQNANLANLYVASYRLHGTLDYDEVVLAIMEILANLVGCEEAALFELDAKTRCLRLVRASGIDTGPFTSVPLGTGIVGSAALAGEILIAPQLGTATPLPGEEHLTACVPVLVAEQVVGLIAVFRLLSHKPALEELDRELFELLAHQAGTALHGTKLHALHGLTPVEKP